MKDSQVRIRIPIHHSKEHRRASPEGDSHGSIAVVQAGRPVPQQIVPPGASAPDRVTFTARRTAAAVTPAQRPIPASPPVSGAATTRGSLPPALLPHLRPSAGRVPRWGSRRPWLPAAAMAGLLALALVPCPHCWHGLATRRSRCRLATARTRLRLRRARRLLHACRASRPFLRCPPRQRAVYQRRQSRTCACTSRPPVARRRCR